MPTLDPFWAYKLTPAYARSRDSGHDYGTAPPRNKHHTIFAGIDRGKEVLAARGVIGKPGANEARSFKNKKAQYKQQDAQDRAAQERQDAQSCSS